MRSEIKSYASSPDLAAQRTRRYLLTLVEVLVDRRARHEPSLEREGGLEPRARGRAIGLLRAERREALGE